MITYEYLRNGPDQYIVVKRWLEEGKQKIKQYNVSFKNGGMLCDCPGFSRWKKKCKHVKGILEQLKDKGGIIRDVGIEDFDWKEQFGI